MASCQPSNFAKGHRGSFACAILCAKMCAQKQPPGARDVRRLSIRVREVLISKEIASWAARSAFPKWPEGRHPHCHFRGLLRLYSRYGPPDRSATQGGLGHEAPARPVTRPNRSSATRSIDNSLGGIFLHK